ncbi:MAG: redoxin family protein [Steroidobacteraceae bacterium]
MKAGAVIILLTCLGLLWAPDAGAAQHVDNFTLLDQNGKSHKLYYHSDKKAIVVMVQGNGCPITRAAWNALKEIRAEFAGKGVEFLMLNPNLQDDRASIQAEAREFGYDIPILIDRAQLVGEALGVTRTAEVFVIDTKSWDVAYRGPIDDRVTYERQRATAKETWLTDALNNLLAGRPTTVAKRDSVGCIVNFPHRDAPGKTISYSKTIAPLLVKNCVSCHQQGGIAPWAMTGYDKVRGFAPMIREVVRTQRMPPWHADPAVGHWVADRSLSPDDAATLVHWVEEGAPRGDGPDPLAVARAVASEWPLGKPDLVLTLPAFQVPATGVVSYQYQTVANPLDKPVWVRATVVLPGDRTVVHHILTGYNAGAGAGASTGTGTPAAAVGGRANGLGAALGGISVFESSLSGYVPGNDAHVFPANTGVLIEPGGSFVFQIHYTPTGKPSTDVTRLGLYFYDKPPKQIMRNVVAINPLINIEPNAAAHEETAYILFDKPAIIYSLFPHAHYRGSSSKFEIQYPDGRVELLLSVPRYDFNWQRDYIFEKPLEVPAGSKIIHTTVYDNTMQNPANPDPAKRVTFGEQSWEEMLYGGIRFRWRDETADHVIHDQSLMRVQQLFGYLDRNRDDGITAAELPGMMQRLAGPGFLLLDQNGDGKLGVAELSSLLGGMRSLLGAPAR